MIGPLTGVTAPRIREALIALHRQHSDHPCVCRVDGDALRWVPVSTAEYAYLTDTDIASFVWPEPGSAERAGPDGRATAEALRDALAREPLGDRPLRVLVCGGFVGVRMSHAIGDGRVFNTLVPEIVTAAAEGRPPRLPFPHPTRLALARASLRFFGRDPRRIVTLARAPRPVLPQPGPDEPRRPWRPDVCSFYARSDGDVFGVLRQWRDAHLPGVSVAAMLFAATCAAFRECGLEPGGPGIMIVVDARRYLSKRATVDGNFAAAQYVVPDDRLDPRAIHQVMGEAVAAGRPLSSLALYDLQGLRSGTGGPPTQVRVRPGPQLTLTHIGRLQEYGQLPWACAPSGRMVLSAPTPGSPEAVTVTFAESAGAVHLNVTFHRSTYEPDEIQRVGGLICADPLRLLAARDSGAAARR